MERLTSIENALDEALDALVASDPGRARDLVEGHPESAELAALLSVAAGVRETLSAVPSPAVRARHVRTLMEEAGRLSDPQTVAAPARRPSPLRRWLLRPVAVLGIVAILGGPATAAFASDALPGDPLYGTKLAVEKLRLAIERDPAGDVDLHLAFAERRLDELSRLIAEGASGKQIGRALAGLKSHREAARRGVDAMQGLGKDREALKAHLGAVLQKHVTVLGGLAEQAGCEQSDPDAGKPQCRGLLNAIDNSQKALDRRGGAATGQEPPGQEPPGQEKKPDTPPGPPPGKGPGAETSSPREGGQQPGPPGDIPPAGPPTNGRGAGQGGPGSP